MQYKIRFYLILSYNILKTIRTKYQKSPNNRDKKLDTQSG